MARILIVDDEASIRRTLKDILEFESFIVDEAADGMEGVVKVKQGSYDVVILDVKMPKLDGMEALERIQAMQSDLPVIMISGHGDINTAVEAVKKGAFDFIRNAMDKSSLIEEKKTLQKKVSKSKTQPMIGSSVLMEKINRTIEMVAPTEARVLINGQNGTGKELVARWIHEKSNRNGSSLVEVNCAAIPSELIESELFGHEKGSFTSAHKQRLGKFELANGGTLFLDEIGDMSLSAQAKVLRALQENKITRVGGEKELSVDVRIIAATNKDLRKEIAKGNFREDLYHRLAVIVVEVPSLAERSEDIPQLVEHFTNTICEEYNIPVKNVEQEAVKLLQECPWTGNIRELRNVIERLIILSNKSITVEDVKSFVFIQPKNREITLKEVLQKFDTCESLKHFVENEYFKLKQPQFDEVIL
ncbi:MAG TPA: sigma-54 dependent transcriptional regulator [Saprospiraceae bacterium]|nr:sigma-54 dependent transcriptional regulator [Saprospiraceae bacterium]